MVDIHESDKTIKIFNLGDTVYFEYKNEYEPFEKTGEPWIKDPLNICNYCNQFSTGNGVIGRHWHESLEIIYMVQGSIEVTTANGSILVGDGEAIVIGGTTLHGIKSISSNGNHQCLHIKYDFLSKYLNRDDFTLKIFKISNISKFLFYYENVIKHIEADSYISQIKYKANLLLLLTTIVEDENYAKENVITSNFNDTINKIIYYINFNYKENITLNYVAEKFNYTPQNISILFKKCLGKTFHKYLTEIRLENAVHLLLNSDKKIIEISLECGFPNEMAFINKFKIKYNMTPNLYRKQKSKELREKNINI